MKNVAENMQRLAMAIKAADFLINAKGAFIVAVRDGDEIKICMEAVPNVAHMAGIDPNTITLNGATYTFKSGSTLDIRQFIMDDVVFDGETEDFVFMGVK